MRRLDPPATGSTLPPRSACSASLAWPPSRCAIQFECARIWVCAHATRMVCLFRVFSEIHTRKASLIQLLTCLSMFMCSCKACRAATTNCNTIWSSSSTKSEPSFRCLAAQMHKPQMDTTAYMNAWIMLWCLISTFEERSWPLGTRVYWLLVPSAIAGWPHEGWVPHLHDQERPYLHGWRHREYLTKPILKPRRINLHAFKLHLCYVFPAFSIGICCQMCVWNRVINYFLVFPLPCASLSSACPLVFQASACYISSWLLDALTNRARTSVTSPTPCTSAPSKRIAAQLCMSWLHVQDVVDVKRP